MNYLIYKSRALNFAFRKLEFDRIYNADSNESPFKYYISTFAYIAYVVRGGGGSRGKMLM